MVRLVALLVGLALGVAVPASAQDKTDIEALRKQGYSVRMISPIFSQLVMLSLPKGFTTVFEDTSGSQYTREAVLEGESVERWSQMITVTGAKGLASNPRLSAQSFVEQIAGGFKNVCPDTFSAKGLGALKISGRDAYTALAGCGTVSSDGSAHSEVGPAGRDQRRGRLLHDPVGRARPRIGPADDLRRSDVEGEVQRARSDQALPDQAGRSAALSELRRPEVTSALAVIARLGRRACGEPGISGRPRASPRREFWISGFALACAPRNDGDEGNAPTLSIRPRHAEHVLGEIAQDEVGRDRRHLVEAGLAELALDVVFLGEAEAAVGLHAGFACGP